MLFSIYGHGGHLKFRLMAVFFISATTIFILNMNLIKIGGLISEKKNHCIFFMNGSHGNQSCDLIFIKASYKLLVHCLKGSCI